MEPKCTRTVAHNPEVMWFKSHLRNQIKVQTKFLFELFYTSYSNPRHNSGGYYMIIFLYFCIRMQKNKLLFSKLISANPKNIQ